MDDTMSDAVPEADQPVLDCLDRLERKAFEENIPVDRFRIHPDAAELCLVSHPEMVHLREFKGLPVTVDARLEQDEITPVWEGGVPTCYAAGGVDLPTRIDMEDEPDG